MTVTTSRQHRSDEMSDREWREYVDRQAGDLVERMAMLVDAFSKLGALHDALAERVAKLEAKELPPPKLSREARAARVPRSPEFLVGALQNRIHPTSGRLLGATPIAAGQLASALPIDEDAERRLRDLANKAQATWKTRPIATEQLASEGEASSPVDQLDWLRRNGWTVAVHNDYRIDGVPMTFWLLTHSDGRWIKGEGRNDAQALQAARDSISKEPPAEPVSPALCGDAGPRDVFCSRYEGHELPHRGWKSDKGSEWWPRGVTPPPASWESATESVSAPAEQPSRQETPGGETCDFRCGKLEGFAPTATGAWDDGLWYCTPACRDRAKAKAAELALCPTCGEPVDAKSFRVSICSNSCHPRPAEPSGTGQLPSAPVGYCYRCNENVAIEGHECPPWRWVCACNTGDPVFHSHYREGAHRCARCGKCDAFRPVHPIAEPPAPAVGTLSEAVNALPDQVRRYVHDIEANCDPAGTVRDNVLLRDHLAALEAKLALVNEDAQRAILAVTESLTNDAADLRTKFAQAERERDDLAEEVRDLEARLAQSEKREEWWSNEATQWAADRDEQVMKLAQVERERDEATARERERCLYFANIYLNDEELSADWIVERISSGAPIP